MSNEWMNTEYMFSLAFANIAWICERTFVWINENRQVIVAKRYMNFNKNNNLMNIETIN